MKLFLDDLRNPPDDTWTVYRCPSAIQFDLVHNWDEITHISFDHDLAAYRNNGEEITGYDVACDVEKYAFEKGYCPFTMTVHSANPEGKRRIESVINAIHRRFPTKL